MWYIFGTDLVQTDLFDKWRQAVLMLNVSQGILENKHYNLTVAIKLWYPGAVNWQSWEGIKPDTN